MRSLTPCIVPLFPMLGALWPERQPLHLHMAVCLCTQAPHFRGLHMPRVLSIKLMLSIGLTVAGDIGPALASSAMQGSILLKTEVSQRG